MFKRGGRTIPVVTLQRPFYIVPQVPPPAIHIIPDDILRIIFVFSQAIYVVGRVCRRWQNAVSAIGPAAHDDVQLFSFGNIFYHGHRPSSATLKAIMDGAIPRPTRPAMIEFLRRWPLSPEMFYSHTINASAELMLLLIDAGLEHGETFLIKSDKLFLKRPLRRHKLSYLIHGKELYEITPHEILTITASSCKIGFGLWTYFREPGFVNGSQLQNVIALAMLVAWSPWARNERLDIKQILPMFTKYPALKNFLIKQYRKL